MTGTKETPRQACDNCRFRKVKCDRGEPCRNCDTGSLKCQYLHTIRKKGPPCGRGRRQSQLRRGLTDFDKNNFHIITPDTSFRFKEVSTSNPNPSVSVSSEEWQSQTNLPEPSQSQSQSQPQSQSPVQSSSHQSSSDSPSTTGIQNSNALTQPDFFDAGTSLDDFLLDAESYSRRLSLSLTAHIQVFVKYLFPIMPVIDVEDLVTDAMRLDELPPSRYSLITALCSATRIQLSMDQAEAIAQGPKSEVPLEPELSGEMLLSLSESSIRQYNVIDDETLDSLLASFFMFASYGNLNNARHAWFYLNQSISLAQSLDITRESGYVDLPEVERERRRRVFWLLFVTERTFALQHRRPVHLRSCIAKPQVIDSNCPVVMHDFINHISLFEALPCTLYEWQSQSDNQQPEDLSLTQIINNKLCAVQPGRSVLESQRFDTLITQQWLRVSMWRLAFGKKPTPAYNRGFLLPLSLPVEAGKLIMGSLDSVGSRSKDCHGIGMEQKLFDVGVSLADSTLLPGWNTSSFDVGPRDVLYAVVRALSKARGCPSHLLPMLLKHSESALGFADPTAHTNLQWEVQQESYENPAVEDVTDADASIDPITWNGDDLGLLDMGTPALCQDTSMPFGIGKFT